MAFPGTSTYPGVTTFPGGTGSTTTPTGFVDRYTDQGNTKIYFLDIIIAADLTPTRSELDNGTDLSPQINDITGWQITSNKIDVLTLETRFVKKSIALATVQQAALTLYTSKNGIDVRGSLPRGKRGYVVFLDGGDGNLADVFPVLVTSSGVIRTAVGKDASKVIIQFAVTTKPAQSVTVPPTGAELLPADDLYPSDTLLPL